MSGSLITQKGKAGKALQRKGEVNLMKGNSKRVQCKVIENPKLFDST